MPESKHTPGEWKQSGFRVYVGDHEGGIARTIGDFNMARLRGTETMTAAEFAEAEANTTLFLAAPDLLAACKAVLKGIEGDNGGPAKPGEASSIEIALIAAIAKAEGR